MFGPILAREWLVAPRRIRFYLIRVVFVLALFSLVCTAWAVLAGIQTVRNQGDLARFGVLIFRIVVPLELIVTMFLAAVSSASNVSQEKDRRTLVLLLLTRLTNSQVVLGKLSSSLLNNFNLILAALPLLLLIAILGGVSLGQVYMATALIAVSTMWSGALANLIAFWREKTFQTLAITLLAIASWLAFCEIIATGSISLIAPHWADVLSPIRAVWLLCRPIPSSDWLDWLGGAVAVHCYLGLAACCVFSLIAVARLRIWNPSQQVRVQAPELDEDYSADRAKLADNPATWKVRSPRPMWSNPILWREVCTWAYGRKMLIIRLAYMALFLVAIGALYWSVSSGSALQRSRLAEELMPTAAKILAPFIVVSFVMINALAVNSITNERDGQALDLLLATQITPRQFLLGKILGVLYVTKEMILLPMLALCYLWYQGGVTTENFCYCAIGVLVIDLFAAMLGIHCGMIYAQSRTAIGTSMGTVFFLFLGILTCMMIMLNFRGSFAVQLGPFLAIILGGGTGLFVAMGHRNPSPAIGVAAFGLPFLTFFAITSFILRNQELTVFLVSIVAYGFATLSMVIPALSEFDFAMSGRSKTADED